MITCPHCKKPFGRINRTMSGCITKGCPGKELGPSGISCQPAG